VERRHKKTPSGRFTILDDAEGIVFVGVDTQVPLTVRQNRRNGGNGHSPSALGPQSGTAAAPSPVSVQAPPRQSTLRSENAHNPQPKQAESPSMKRIVVSAVKPAHSLPVVTVPSPANAATGGLDGQSASNVLSPTMGKSAGSARDTTVREITSWL
jgi:hypothetical protein